MDANTGGASDLCEVPKVLRPPIVSPIPADRGRVPCTGGSRDGQRGEPVVGRPATERTVEGRSTAGPMLQRETFDLTGRTANERPPPRSGAPSRRRPIPVHRKRSRSQEVLDEGTCPAHPVEGWRGLVRWLELMPNHGIDDPTMLR